MMHTAKVTLREYVPENQKAVDCDQFYGSKDDPNGKEYIVSCYSREGLIETIKGLRSFNILAVDMDGGDNPCGCGIRTCMDGELCGMPPRRGA